jgi:RNA polymerase sigma-70 factor (ECF subfamily)
VEEGRPRFEADRERAEELAQRFFAAAQEGELSQLEELLSEDVVLHGDGGGKAPALARSLHGRERVARTLAAWMRTLGRLEGARLRPVDVNREPGAMLETADGELFGVMVLDVAGDRIQGVRSIVNPDKLARLGPVADVEALQEQLRNRGR